MNYNGSPFDVDLRCKNLDCQILLIVEDACWKMKIFVVKATEISIIEWEKQVHTIYSILLQFKCKTISSISLLCKKTIEYVMVLGVVPTLVECRVLSYFYLHLSNFPRQFPFSRQECRLTQTYNQNMFYFKLF